MDIRRKKLTAFTLVLAMVLSSGMPFPIPGESELGLYAAYGGEAVSDTLTGSGNSCQSKEAYRLSDLIRQEALALSSLEADKDYIDGEGVFLASSLKEAERIAESYDAKLLSFENGVASVRLPGSTEDSLIKAAESGKAEALIDPNFTFSLSGLPEAEDLSIPDITTPSEDPFLNEDSPCFQYHHLMTGTGEAIKLTSGNGIRVAVVDTGVNPEHEELKGRVSVNYINREECIATGGIDSHGHGTHVCGLIGAIMNNGHGGMGVAPGVLIDSIQITTTGKGFTLSEVAEGLRMAIDRGVDIISLSVGSEGRSITIKQLTEEAAGKGIVLVAAAGNSGSDIRNYPAAEDGVIAVGWVDSKGERAGKSNYGKWVDIAAPGSGLISTYIPTSSGKNLVSGDSLKNAYGKLSGTSQATPLVAGAAALCYSLNPGLFKSRNYDSALLIKEALCGFSEVSGKDSETAGILRSDRAANFINSINPSAGISIIDKAGHYGTVLAGQGCLGKSIRLKLGNADGKPDKKLTNKAVWESSDEKVARVSKGKVKVNKDAKPGATAIITASYGDDKVYFTLETEEKIKKFGKFDESKKTLKSSFTLEKNAGEILYISDPCSAIGEYSVYLASDDSKNSSLNNASFAGGRHRYKISMSKGDLKKVRVEETDTNGDPLRIALTGRGSIKVRYKLLDGSGKRFTLKIRVS